MTDAKPPISTYLIVGARCSPQTEGMLRAMNPSAEPCAEISFQVFEVHIDGQVRYCCWSGGTLRDEQGRPVGPRFTLVGQAAFEALSRLPFASGKELTVCEVRVGVTPIRDKIIERFRQSAGTRDLICFIGDLAEELNGRLPEAFNLCGAIKLSECGGTPGPDTPVREPKTQPMSILRR